METQFNDKHSLMINISSNFTQTTEILTDHNYYMSTLTHPPKYCIPLLLLLLLLWKRERGEKSKTPKS